MKVALVHEWLLTHGGSEEITGQLGALFPDADLFTLVADPVPSLKALIGERRIVTSWLQKIPGATRRHRLLLPLMPGAIERFDFAAYDLVISVSHAVTKGVRTTGHTTHLNICCSPIRYAWDLQEQYLAESGLSQGLRGAAARALLKRIRLWDKRTANRPTQILAISQFISERIARVWGRTSGLLYPPVETAYFAEGAGRRAGESVDSREPSVAREPGVASEPSVAREPTLYVTASRLVPYKRIPLIVEAFQQLPDRKLVVIGDGPEMPRARALAGPNVTLLGHCPRAELRDWLQRANGFVFAAEEDFGIAPVEALAAGTPVVAYGKGGALETVSASTGVFFETQTADAIAGGVRRLEAAMAGGVVTRENCVAQAEKFSVARFREGIMEQVRKVMAERGPSAEG